MSKKKIIIIILFSIFLSFFLSLNSTSNEVYGGTTVMRCDIYDNYLVYDCEVTTSSTYTCDYTTTLNTPNTYCCTLVRLESSSPKCPLGSGTSPSGESSAVEPSNNPDLPADACGLDIALILDDSGSIDPEELKQMKDAFKLFVDALEDTPTLFSVTRFDSSSSVIQGFTDNTSLVKAAIDSCSSGGNTNWEDAFVKSWSTFDPRSDYPNLVIFSSDGNANTVNSGTELSAIDAAITEANVIRDSGTRIFGIAIGDDLNTNYLEAVTGTNTNSPDLLSRDLIVSSFEDLAQDLSAFARSACGGTITITKYLETVSDSTKGGSGWEYSITGKKDNKELTTGSDGRVNTGLLKEGIYSVIESGMASSQYFYDSAVCTRNGSSVGNVIENGIGDIAMDHEDIVSCTFLNRTEPPNEEPEVLSINVEREKPDEVLGFSSTTHTGEELNNRVIDGNSAKTKVTAEFADPDGISDLTALSVWWSTSSSKNFITPTELSDSSNSPKTANNGNFGILIKKDVATGEWKEVYAPFYNSVTKKYYWVKVPVDNGTYTIKGSNGENMVEISDLVISENEDTGELKVTYLIKFLTGNTKVNTDKYYLWGSVYDIHGFTELDGKVIKNFGDDYWYTNSNWTWNVDLTDPRITNFKLIHNDNNTVNIDLTVDDKNDGLKVSNVRMDACIEGVDLPDNLYVPSLGLYYELLPCDQIESKINFDSDFVSESLFGAFNVNTEEFSTTVTIDLQNNTDGVIKFYLSALDYAGNYTSNYNGVIIDTPPIVLTLYDWALVEDGFVFGNTGTLSTAYPIANTVNWGTSPLTVFKKSLADLTNHVLLGGNTIGTNKLVELIKYKPTENKSFKASNYQGVYTSSIYDDLVIAYEFKSVSTNFKEENITKGKITDSLSSNVTGCNPSDDNSYCIIRKESGDFPLEIGNTSDNYFECNHKGLIIVDGDLKINTNIINTDIDDACIILVSGNVEINIPKAGTGSPVAYDRLQTFIIAGGEIRVTDNSDEGLYIEGGLVGLSTSGASSVINDDIRNIVTSKKTTYPVIAVKCRSKYGLLARKLFGTPIDVFKTEVGFKPY